MAKRKTIDARAREVIHDWTQNSGVILSHAERIDLQFKIHRALFAAIRHDRAARARKGRP